MTKLYNDKVIHNDKLYNEKRLHNKVTQLHSDHPANEKDAIFTNRGPFKYHARM